MFGKETPATHGRPHVHRRAERRNQSQWQSGHAKRGKAPRVSAPTSGFGPLGVHRRFRAQRYGIA